MTVPGNALVQVLERLEYWGFALCGGGEIKLTVERRSTLGTPPRFGVGPEGGVGRVMMLRLSKHACQDHIAPAAVHLQHLLMQCPPAGIREGPGCPGNAMPCLVWHCSSSDAVDKALASAGGIPSRSYTEDRLRKAPIAANCNRQLPQTAMITFTDAAVASAGGFLARLVEEADDLHVAGCKWLAGLLPQQAREVTPHEVGDRGWKASIQRLCG